MQVSGAVKISGSETSQVRLFVIHRREGLEKEGGFGKGGGVGLTDFIVTRKCKSGQYLRLYSRFFCAVEGFPQRLAKNSVAARAR